MSRPAREQMFMEVARTVAKRSTCHRLNVGAVLVVDHNIVSMGYNGAHSGAEHCGGTGCQYFVPTKGCGVVHAEENAISRAPEYARKGDLYVTHSPCVRCAELVLSVDIEAVYYETEYRDPAGIEVLLRKPTLLVRRLQPSGYLLDRRTGDVINL